MIATSLDGELKIEIQVSSDAPIHGHLWDCESMSLEVNHMDRVKSANYESCLVCDLNNNLAPKKLGTASCVANFVNRNIQEKCTDPATDISCVSGTASSASRTLLGCVSRALGGAGESPVVKWADYPRTVQCKARSP